MNKYFNFVFSFRIFIDIYTANPLVYQIKDLYIKNKKIREKEKQKKVGATYSCVSRQDDWR